MSLNLNPSLLDQQTIIQRAFEKDDDALRVKGNFTATIEGDIVCDIDASTGDNIAIANADGSKKADVETVNGKNGLDVNILNQIQTSPVGLSKALDASRIIVTDVPTKLPAVALIDRNTISVRVLGSSTIFFGDSNVAATTGYPKFFGEEIFMDIRDNPAVDLYGICASGQSSEVAILQIS